MNTSYCSAVVDGEKVEFAKPTAVELEALKAVVAAHPEFMVANILNAKGKKIGAFFNVGL